MGLLAGLPARAEEAFLEDTGRRARWGFSAGLGSALGLGGAAMRTELRLGYQVSRRFSLFGVLAGGSSLGPVFGGHFDFGAAAEFTPVDWFYLGGGLVSSYGTTFMTVQSAPQFGYAVDPLGGSFRPALDLRLGFSTGASRPPWFNRFGFNIGVHALLMVHPNMTVTRTSPSGQQSIVRNSVQVAFTPMLTLGFDSR